MVSVHISMKTSEKCFGKNTLVVLTKLCHRATENKTDEIYENYVSDDTTGFLKYGIPSMLYEYMLVNRNFTSQLLQ